MEGMRALIIAAIVIAASGAEASASSRSHGDLERIDNGHATLTFVFKSSSKDAREVIEAIELPVGMSATGLRISIEGSEAASAIAFAPKNGRDVYEGIVAQIKDPALLEYTGPNRATLRVFPVRRGAPATVVIELTATSLVNATELVHLGQRVSLLAAPRLPNPDDERSFATRYSVVSIVVAEEKLQWHRR
jgi:hypothetical protein